MLYHSSVNRIDKRVLFILTPNFLPLSDQTDGFASSIHLCSIHDNLFELYTASDLEKLQIEL